MVREIVTINVGQCGVQMGGTVWRQYLTEHSINWEGKLEAKDSEDSQWRAFFEESSSGTFVPRNISVDLNPDTIDAVRNSKYGSLFNANLYNAGCLLSGKEDAAKNFARGHYTVGKEIIDKVNDRLRRFVGSCDNVAGFIINHSVGGGTGSGLGALILERVAVDYRKRTKLGFEVYPSPTISTSVTEPLNALLGTHWLLDHTEASLLLDNEAIFELCQKKLDQQRPTFECMNQLTAKIISSTTTPIRFDLGGSIGTDISEYQTDLVPFTRLHFLIGSTLPITTKDKVDKTRSDVQSITEHCFSSANFFTKLRAYILFWREIISEFDPMEDRYIALRVMYHGDVVQKEAESAFNWMRTCRGVQFIDWVPQSCKIGYRKTPIAVMEDDPVAASKRNIAALANNPCISRFFSQRISKIFDKMYSQRAYIFWYVGEGMEEGEFAEAREDLGFLEMDYRDVLSEQATDEEEEEED